MNNKVIYKKYIRYYFIGLFFAFLLLVLFNLSVKSYYSNRPLMALLKKPSSVIIGTSTANFGLDPEHHDIVFDNYYSIPVSGVKNKLVWIKRFDSLNDLENVILCLDFFEYNNYRVVQDINENGSLDNQFLIIINLFKELISIDSFIYSIRKFFGSANEIVLYNGHLWQKDRTSLRTFETITLSELETILPKPEKKFTNYSYDNSTSKLDYLKGIIYYCGEQNINLVMIIPPRHMALTEMERSLNINKYFNEWKAELVKLVNEYRNNFPERSSPQLWDFALINDFTAEKLPHDGKSNMKWFMDRIHFKKDYGDLIFNMVFSSQNENHSLPPNFGARIDTVNIYDYLTEHEIVSEKYRINYKELIERIRINVNQTMSLYNN